MTKMRIYEYAKKQNVSSKEIIERLKDLKIEVKNHMATIAEEIVEKLNKSFQPKSVEAKQPQKTTIKPSIKVIPAFSVEASEELDYEVDYLEDTKVKTKKNSNKKKKTDSQKQSSQNEDRQTNGNKKGNQNMNQKNNSTENTSNKIIFSGSLKVSELAKKLARRPAGSRRTGSGAAASR